MENSTTYKERIARLSPSSPVLKNCFFAFIGGGSICLLGEAIARFFFRYFTPSDSYTLVTVAFIFAGALLTGLGVFDSIARLLGAGTLLPVELAANVVGRYQNEADAESPLESAYRDRGHTLD
jgi:stage V sporulation protein AC